MEIAVLVSAGILLAVLGGLVGVALGRYIWPAIRDSYTAALLTAQMQATKFEEECRSLRKQAEQLEAERAARIEELRQSGQEAARLGERVEVSKARLRNRRSWSGCSRANGMRSRPTREQHPAKSRV